MKTDRAVKNSRRLALLLALTVAMVLVMGATSALASTAFPGTGTWSNRVTYYTANDGVNFSRSTVPITTGVATQAAVGDAVTVAISNTSGYADSGVAFYAGRLGDLPNFTLTGAGTAYSLNLWFDTNNDGEYFAWSSNVLTGLAGDNYGLGPSSVGGTLTMNDSSSFGMMSGSYGPFTLGQLKAGAVSGITADTHVAIWIGVAGGTPMSSTVARATYTVAASAGANGSASPAGQTVFSGDSATVNVAPASGYYCSSLLVDGLAVAPATSHVLSGVTANHSVTAAFSALSPVEVFAYSPLLTSAPTAGAWYTDRYAPSGFAKATFDGDTRLKISISTADSAATRPPAYSSGFYNTQGRKYDVGGASFASADLYVGSDWNANNRRSDLWTTAVDGSGVVIGYPIIGFVHGQDNTSPYTGYTGFRVWDNFGWHEVGLPAGFTYGSWHNLRIQLNSGRSVSYYVDNVLVYESLFTVDTGMAPCVGFSDLMLQAWNFGDSSYDAYWDNVAPVPPFTGYTITTTAGANGSISPVNPVVDRGGNASLAITPNAGYHIADVTVNGSSVGVTNPVVLTNVSANQTVGATFAANAIDTITVLDPSWSALGGGGVFSAYYGPPTYPPVSPGQTDFYLGRQAGLIMAGLAPDLTDGKYWDEGLLGFQPGCTIGELAADPLRYDVANQSGANPVWMTIEVGDPVVRTANKTYQFIPTTNPAGWHTVDAGAGMWQLMDDATGNGVGPMMTLNEVAAAAAPAPKLAVRVYLRLGMGDSYHDNSLGTVGWVDSLSAGYTTYDFAIATYTVTASAGANGAVTPASQMVYENDNAAVTITADPGYHVADVLVDGTSVGSVTSYTFTNVTANHSVSATFAADSVTITELLPSWTGTGGGGVFSAYVGPPAYGYVSPGVTDHYLGRMSGVIKAGQGLNPGSPNWDEGLFGFKPGCSISTLAANPLIYDVANQDGTNPVWMTIEVGDPVDRSANKTYQFIPTTNPDGWHTVDARAGLWQLMDTSTGNGVGPMMTLSQVAAEAAPAPKQVVRVYLRLGMGDSYYAAPNGTVGWVDNLVAGMINYEFEVSTYSITATAGAHGSVSPTSQTIYAHHDATVDITPAAGYYCSGLLVDGASVAPIGAYGFSNITANHTVAATFSPLTPLETFANNPVLSPTKVAGAWYTDRYAPAGFTKASFDGDTRLKISISTADSAANRPPAYSGGFYNTQGRKYDVGGATFASANLYVGADWGANNRRSDLWATAVDGSGNVLGYPIIGFVHGQDNTLPYTGYTGFRVWDNFGWHEVGLPAGFTYGSWHNLRIQLNAGRSVSYYIDDLLVYESLFTVDTDMAPSVGFSDLMLQAWNFGDSSYDVFWDNAAPVPPTTPYTISASGSAGGSVSPASQTVGWGDDAAPVAITPNAGYYTSSLVVDGSLVTPRGSITFTSVMGNHAVAATFAAVAPVEPFDHTPVLSPTKTAGAWYPDRYAPAGFAKTAFDGGLRLKQSISSADSAANRPPAYSDAFYNTQGRSYDVHGAKLASADLYIGADWATSSRRADLWATAVKVVDSGDTANITGWPIIGFINGTGFRVWDNNGWHTVGFPAGFAYGRWYNLRMQLTPVSVGYYIDGQLVYESTFVADPDMATAVGFDDVKLQAYNYGDSYDVYWDNAAPCAAATGYAITTSPDAHTSISPSNPTVDWSDNATFTITPNTGYHLTGVTVDSVSQGAIGTYTFTAVTSAHVISASSAINTYTLTPTAGANGTISPATTATVNYGTTTTFTITPAAGYHVATLVVDSTPVAPATSYTFSSVSANHTIAATFAINTFTLAPSAGANGSISPASTQTVNFGANQTFTMTPATGYNVATVTVDGAPVGSPSSYTFSAVAANHVIGVTFADKTAPSTFSDVSAVYVNSGTIRLTASDVNGVGHTYYKLDGGSQVESGTIVVTGFGPHTIEFWSVDTLGNVEVHKTAGFSVSDTIAPSTTSNAVANYTGSASIHLTATDNAGGAGVAATYYKLDGGAQTGGTNVSTSVTGAHTLEFWSVDGDGNEELPHKVANFAVNAVTFNVTASAGSNGSIAPSGVVAVVAGADSPAFAITANTGFHIADVLVDGASVGAVGTYTFHSVAGPHTIAASFAPDIPSVTTTYTITAQANAGGVVTPGVQAVQSGANATVTITPNNGFHIESVLLDGSPIPPTSPVILLNVTASHTLAVTFAADGPGATSINIRSTATSTRRGRSFVLSGFVTPQTMIGTNIQVMVKKPGRAYFSYSSLRTCYATAATGGLTSWWYRYNVLPTMPVGTYQFYAFVPASATYQYSRSSTLVIPFRR
jgi:hypothetical protein